MKMSTLTTQLQELKKQQEELMKRIQEEAETKKKLNNASSIERLEALVEPITEHLNKTLGNKPLGISVSSMNERNQYQHNYEQKLQRWISLRRQATHHKPRKNAELEKEEIYVTLIGILKKQDERIKNLESQLNQHCIL